MEPDPWKLMMFCLIYLYLKWYSSTARYIKFPAGIAWGELLQMWKTHEESHSLMNGIQMSKQFSSSPEGILNTSPLMSLKPFLAFPIVNGHFRNLNWRYLPYGKAYFLGLCKGISPHNT